MVKRVCSVRFSSRESSPQHPLCHGACHGTGCFLELNGSGITKDQWLRPGDVVSLAIDGLGTLTHTIVEDPEK